MMTRTRLVIIGGFLLSFAAGLTIGLSGQGVVSGAPDPEKRKPGGPSGWLAERLKLTDEQRQQVEKIWSETIKGGGRDQQWAQKSKLRRERDDAISALISGEQRAAYDQILADYEAKTEALENKWRESFKLANERTMAILTPQQQEEFKKLMDRHDGGRDRGGPPHGGPPPGPRPEGPGGPPPPTSPDNESPPLR